MGDESTPLETFDRVNNPLRLAILRALARAFSESPIEPHMRYSDLREAVGARDKGNFNYHLDRLDGLVTKTPEGYAITDVGLTVVSTVASRSLDPDWEWGPRDVPGECFFCGDSLTLRHEDGHLLLTCGSDDHGLVFSAPPSLVDDHPDDELLERVALVLYQQATQVKHGVCPECRGDVTPEIVPEPRPGGDYFFRGDCHNCGFQHGFPVGAAALSHPDVIAAVAEDGEGVRTTPFWTLPWCHVGHEAVVSEDPFRARVDVRRGGDPLTVTLDRSGTVVSVDGPSPV
jgi:DNA-binding transcriptional ArsR family regulator